ncbi:MMPL family transporter [Cytobacillus sp. FJAT-54145]|uniref:MMPL family transporter n=1 Tax=Cytobacillus spartinae TaxID=3299023 RepID=A0ABW6KGV3_9BACI
MNFIVRKTWFIFIAWIAVTVGLFLVAPNMGELVREKGEITVPDEYSSTLAGNILEEVKEQEGGGDDTSVALVFHNEEKLTEENIQEARKAIELLEENKTELGITEILTHFNEETLENQLVSEDGKAILASVTLNWNNREAKEVSEALYETIEEVKVDHYYTSQWMINEDLNNSAQEGLKKTEGITVVFILIVLLLVFKSVVAPIIPLVTVGFSYLISQSIVSFLVDKFDFPISNYTQIFLVAVLFGIGTDYCILLLSRFKEELAQHEDINKAIIETYRNAGRTVFFSGLAVMIGFAAIGFSQFILYQSAAAVAVGVAFLLIALFTIVPFFMAVLGKKIFWPSKSKAEHGDSKLWELAGRFSLSRPLLSLLIVAVICVPFLLTYDKEISYNSLEEISGDVSSIKAFNAIAGSFSAGESMPTTIILKNDERMDSAEYVGLAEKISQEVEKVDLVDAVRSVTRPTGEQIEDFFVAKQAESLEEGLGEGKDGLSKISEGLQEAGSELAKSEPELKKATEGINELITGTDQVQTGLIAIQTNLAKIETGIRQGSQGSTQLINGLEQAKTGLETLQSVYEEKILAGYKSLDENLTKLNSGYQQVGTGLTELSGGISQVNGALFNHLDSNYQSLATDQIYQELKKNSLSLQQKLTELSGSVGDLNAGLAGIQGGLAGANAGFEEALGQQKQIANGLQKAIEGIKQQQAGLEQLANGQGQIVNNVPKLTSGLGGISDGQEQLLNGFGDLGGQISQLTDGLTQSADGLNQVSDGLGSAQEYLSGLSNTTNMGGFYLPADVLESEDFAQVLDVYMSEDRKVMTMDVVFETSPYSNESMAQVDNIKEAVERATKGTKLENAIVAVGGITSTNVDLDTMSGNDYTRTVILMLIGIGIILVFLFRSIIMPIYIIASLILTYFTSMSINELIFVNIFGLSGISWAVPFFAFVILMALGVDYSIFLMDRFNEYKDLPVAQAMHLAMVKMGTVIISAAIILGGTFAAMMPSGMQSLLQIASIVLVGLVLYAFVVLPLFIPVMVKNFGQANWWPFKRVTNE